MDSMLRRLLATWMNSQELAPRRVPTATVRCESLEGRQLLSTTGLLRGYMGMPSSPAAQRVQLSTRGAMGGQNAGGFSVRGAMGGQNAGGLGTRANASFASLQPGQGGTLRSHANLLSGGTGRGNFALRQGQMPRATLQNMVEATPTTLPGGGPTVVNTSLPTDPSNVTTLPDLGGAVTSNVTTLPDVNGAVTTVQANAVDPAVTTTSLDGGAPGGMAMGSFRAMPSGPLGGWFGGTAGNRQSGNVVWNPGTQGGGPGAIAEPSDALKSDFDKLQTDLQAIQDKSEVTPKLLAAVRKDFDAIQKASTSAPDEDAVKALAATVDSLAGQIPTDEQQAKLVADFTAVLQSQGVTDQTLIDTAVADIQAVVAASHVTADDLATIAADHDAIEAELKAGSEGDPAVTLEAATGDAVGSLMSGLTGGFDSGIPMAMPFMGAGPGVQIHASPINFASAGGVMMDGGGHFAGPAITVSPSGGAMSGPFNIMHSSMGMGGGQFGPTRMISTSGGSEGIQLSEAPSEGIQLSEAPTVGLEGGGAAGTQAVSIRDGKVGGWFGGGWGR